jgi:hypothetical protein
MAETTRQRREGDDTPAALLDLIDRKGLLALGLGEESVERMKLALRVVRMPGDRKWYVRRSDVAAYLDEHTAGPMRGARL